MERVLEQGFGIGTFTVPEGSSGDGGEDPPEMTRSSAAVSGSLGSSIQESPQSFDHSVPRASSPEIGASLAQVEPEF